MINVMTERRQEARNMNTSTMAACVRLRRPTFMLRQIWSDTVVVSADSRLVISPAAPARYVNLLCLMYRYDTTKHPFCLMIAYKARAQAKVQCLFSCQFV